MVNVMQTSIQEHRVNKTLFFFFSLCQESQNVYITLFHYMVKIQNAISQEVVTHTFTKLKDNHIHSSNETKYNNENLYRWGGWGGEGMMRGGDGEG